MNYDKPAKWHVEIEGSDTMPKPIIETWKGEIAASAFNIVNFAIDQAGPENGIRL